MEVQPLGQKRFDFEDQIAFARLSGDHNPMHMDPVFSRRTQAGAPVVHGVHSALIGLEFVAPLLAATPGVTTLKAVFTKMVYVGDLVDYQLKTFTEKSATVEGLAEGVQVFRLVLTFGAAAVADFQPGSANIPGAPPDSPIELAFEDMATQSGWIKSPASVADIQARFPAASQLWSPQRISAILSTTLLVGMVCPGLHSIYGGFTIHAAKVAEPGLRYEVTSVDARFRMVRLQVAGSGVQGSLDCFARTPPVAQSAMSALAGLCETDAFSGSTALIIGGSRGLGELTAKILALGGAKVILTYASGRDDANAVARQITDSGGACDVVPYDFRLPPGDQIQRLAPSVTHFYYFATPQIFRRKAGLFDRARYAEFEQCYVAAFYELFQMIHAASPHGLTAFYPSSIFVTERPREMTEYTMAKAAGEILCEDITAFLPKSRVVFSRLPRLPTDQTASIVAAESADPVAIMLPLIRQVQHPPDRLQRAV